MKRWLPLLLVCLLLLAGCSGSPAKESAQTETPQQASETAVPDAEPTLEKLEIVSKPVKMNYDSGDTFDPTGLRIDAHMSDGSVLEDVAWEIENPIIGPKTSAVNISCMGTRLMLSVTVTVKGNTDLYSVAQTPEVGSSPLKGKTIFWLGSSVTEGASAGGESMVDFIGKKYAIHTIKEAVSGTTLATYKDNSYVERLDAYLASPDRAEVVDAFVCQLSTNDTSHSAEFGQVFPDFITDPAAFDTASTFGAIEYIIARVRETWDCPIYFYTNPPTGNPAYGTMVKGLYQIAEKWNVTVIDLYSDEAFNDITEAERALYMSDPIHPTKAGYREWWLPKFEEALGA